VTQSVWNLNGKIINIIGVIVQGQHPNKRSNLWTSCGFLSWCLPPSFSDTVHGRNPATWWLHHIAGFFFSSTTTFQDVVYGQSSSHWHRLRVSSYCGVFLFHHGPYQPQRSTFEHGGVLLWGHSHEHNHSYPQFTDWGWFLKTYPKVRILTLQSKDWCKI